MYIPKSKEVNLKADKVWHRTSSLCRYVCTIDEQCHMRSRSSGRDSNPWPPPARFATPRCLPAKQIWWLHLVERVELGTGWSPLNWNRRIGLKWSLRNFPRPLTFIKNKTFSAPTPPPPHTHAQQQKLFFKNKVKKISRFFEFVCLRGGWGYLTALFYN
jgi:hypothetical protein